MPQIELTIAGIDQGKMIRELEDALAAVGKAVAAAYLNAPDLATAGKIQLEISITKDKKFENYYDLQWQVKRTLPQKPKSSITLAKFENGAMQVQITGSTKHSPDQEVIDFATGEVING